MVGPVDSVRAVRFEIPPVLKLLRQVPDLTALGFRPDFVARAEAEINRTETNSEQQVNERVGITVNARDLQAAMQRLATLMEQVNASRELAMARSEDGKELPGFDLRYIRAAAASRQGNDAGGNEGL